MTHDHDALDEFAISLDQILTDPNESSRTWLVVTGDLTTFGKQHEVDHIDNWARSLARGKGIGFASIYGNHDVWDGQIPLFSLDDDLDDRRTVLRQQTFAGTWPLHPAAQGSGACATSGATPAIVQAYGRGKRVVVTSLNSILHGSGDNTLAYGEVQADRYWQNGNLPDQVSEMIRRLALSPEDFLVVLTHHPIYFPVLPPPPALGPILKAAGAATGVGLVLKNAKAVAQRLAAPGAWGARPAAALFVSGHTHVTFPAIGDLPASLAMAGGPHPLEAGQVQLIVGTMSQRPYAAKGRHDWQVLSFVEDDSTGVLRLERTVWRRPARFGPFREVSTSAGDTVERMLLQ